jgi:hypothetical protein
MVASHGVKRRVEDALCVEHGQKVINGQVLCGPYSIAGLLKRWVICIFWKWEGGKQSMNRVSHFIWVISPFEVRFDYD